MKLMPILMLLSLFSALKRDTKAVIDLGVVLMIGIAFAGLMVVAYIMFTLRNQLTANIGTGPNQAIENTTKNITVGFDQAITLIIVAVTIFILALAISALLLLRGRRG